MAKEKTTEKPAKVAAVEPELIKLTKDGETITAHPSQVELWQKQGWQIGEE